MLKKILKSLSDDEKLVYFYLFNFGWNGIDDMADILDKSKKQLYYLINKLKNKGLIEVNTINNRMAKIEVSNFEKLDNKFGKNQCLIRQNFRQKIEENLDKFDKPKTIEKPNKSDLSLQVNRRQKMNVKLDKKLDNQIEWKNRQVNQEAGKHYHLPEHTPQKPYRYSKAKVYDDLVGCKIILNLVGWMWAHDKRAVLENLHKAWISAADAKNTFSLNVIENNINDLAFQNEKELIKQVREAFKKERKKEKERTKEKEKKKEKRDLDIYIQKPITNRLVINKIPFVIPNCLVNKKIDIIYNNFRVNNDIEYKSLRSLNIIKIFLKDRILTERIFKNTPNSESKCRVNKFKVSKPKVNNNKNVQKSKTLSADNSLKSYLSKAFQGIKQEIEKNNQRSTVPDDFKSKLVLLLRQHFLKKHAAEMMFILKDLADKNNYLSFYQFLYDFISLKLLKRLQKANNPPVYLRNILKNTNISLEYHLWMNSQDVYSRSLKTEKVRFKIH